MAGYIYLPVPTQEMLNFARDLQPVQIEKGKIPYKILHNYETGSLKCILRNSGRGVLRNVVASDKLYVLAHGASKGCRRIGADRGATKVFEAGVEKWEGGVMKSYTPAELDTVIQK